MEKFSLEANGYNKEEVNKFLQDIIVRYENLIDSLEEKNKEIDKLKNELIECKKSMSVNNILDDAKIEASKILNEALIKAKDEEENSKLLKRNMTILRRKMKILIEQEEAILKEFDDLEESSD